MCSLWSSSFMLHYCCSALYVEQVEKDVDPPNVRQMADGGFKSQLPQYGTACDLGTVWKLSGGGEEVRKEGELCIFFFMLKGGYNKFTHFQNYYQCHDQFFFSCVCFVKYLFLLTFFSLGGDTRIIIVKHKRSKTVRLYRNCFTQYYTQSSIGLMQEHHCIAIQTSSPYIHWGLLIPVL